MNPNEPNTEPITEITEAPMETKEALIDTNETDIQPISRQASIEDVPNDAEEDILEKTTPQKKPRTKKQVEAFAKAQEALKAKRLLRKQEKDRLPKPKRGRPKKVLPIEEKKNQQEEVVEEESESESEEECEEEVFITTTRNDKKKKKKKKQKQKKKKKTTRRIVYVSESESSSESESETESDNESEPEDGRAYAQPQPQPFDGLRFL